MTAASTARVLVTGLLSQGGWFAAVLGAAHGIAWAGPVSALVAVPLGGLLLGATRRVLLLALMAMAAGVIVETAMTGFSLVTYREPGPFSPLPPLWLISLWALFALVIETALTRLDGRLLFQVALAAVGGPLAYLAGEKLGAMEFLEPRARGLAVLAALWALALPALLAGRRKLAASSAAL